MRFKSNHLLLITVLLSAGLLSCESSRQLMDSRSVSKSRQKKDPSFLDGIELPGNSNSFAVKDGPRRNINTAEQSEWNNENSFLPSFLQSKYAGMLGVTPQSVSNFALYHFIEDWYGVRYSLGGSDKNGIDCSGFARRLYEAVFCTSLLRSAAEQFGKCTRIFGLDSLQEGDLVFFHAHGRRIGHVGVYLANNYFVHASTTQGVVISSLNEAYWKRNYAGAGKVEVSAGNF